MPESWSIDLLAHAAAYALFCPASIVPPSAPIVGGIVASIPVNASECAVLPTPWCMACIMLCVLG